MSPTEITALGGVIVALFAAVIVPLYTVRRGDARSAQELKNKESAAAVQSAADIAASREINWENINVALVRERDALRNELNAQSVKYADETRYLRERLDQEAADIRARYDRELSRANDRIEACHNEVDRLRRRIYGMPRDPTVASHRADDPVIRADHHDDG